MNNQICMKIPNNFLFNNPHFEFNRKNNDNV